MSTRLAALLSALTLTLLFALANAAPSAMVAAPVEPVAKTYQAPRIKGWVAVRPCEILRTLPAYRYHSQGATIFEPTGDVRYRDVASEVDGTLLQHACRVLIKAQRAHKGAPAATLTVLKAWGF